LAVTFDGNLKIININFGETQIDIKNDVYSAWKEWILLSDNAKFPVAISAIGGEPLPGGQFLGTTFFLENGWKIKPFEGNHTLTVIGNLYSRDGSDPFTSTNGSFNVRINLTTSSIVSTVSTSGSSTSPSDIAEAVWNAQSVAATTTGTFGNLINDIKDTTEDTDTKVTVMRTLLTNVNEMLVVLMKYQNNRTKVDPTQKTLTIYDDDDVTPLKVFDLKDFLGNSSITQIAERIPR
jgi:hypothetical protein